MALDINKPVRTIRGHLPAKLISEDFSPYPARGPVLVWIITYKDGTQYLQITGKDGLNGIQVLENIPEEPKKHVVYINLYGKDCMVWAGEAHPDRKAADKAAGADNSLLRYKRLSCKRVEFVEGVFDD